MTGTNVKASPQDIFLHFLAIITLYVSAGSFIALIFQYINILIPDALDQNGYYGLIASHQTIRWSIASLIIVFPSYLLTGWYLNKGYIAAPEKRMFRIRKWLLYFTLFIASLVIIGDLVTLIYNMLGGEFTGRFILKVMTVFFVAGSVFGYYFWDLRQHDVE